MPINKRIRIPFLILLLRVKHSLAKQDSITLSRHLLYKSQSPRLPVIIPRGGTTTKDSITDNDLVADEERYSRQIYALGSRAHSLIRSSTIILDGPSKSGLLYETAKNLVLSGVGTIIFLESNEEASWNCTSIEHEDAYFNANLDDLGHVYVHAALAECLTDLEDDKLSSDHGMNLIASYARRLNSGIKIFVKPRTWLIELMSREATRDDDAGRVVENPVFVCVDRPQSTQITFNKICRGDFTHIRTRAPIPFISVETAGIFGKIFCDFGNDFSVIDEDGETPKITRFRKVETYDVNLKSGDTITSIIISCSDGEKHDVSKGDRIRFICNHGVNHYDCDVLHVKNTTCFTASLISDSITTEYRQEVLNRINNDATSFSKLKIPKQISFFSLEEAVQRHFDPTLDLFTPSDLAIQYNLERRHSIMNSFAALNSYSSKHVHLPSQEELVEFIREFHGSVAQPTKTVDEIPHGVMKLFLKCCKAKFVPLQALFGALSAQEALKAVSGLYNPIHQFFLFDCEELMPEDREDNPAEITVKNGLNYILGDYVTEQLSTKQIFLVGAGAIGCELLKNLCALGVGTKGAGKIVITDMDSIEKSNLSRQFLFRDCDVGQFKAIAAQRAAHNLNHEVRVESHTSKVGGDNSGPFDDYFWSEKTDVVMNALDNVEARLFIDSKCVTFEKGLIDAGTLGSKGNVQVVVPHQSESYGSSVDPPELSIPVCTLKNFPYEISHTIQWAREFFDSQFTHRPFQANENCATLHKSDPHLFVRQFLSKHGDDVSLGIMKDVYEDVKNIYRYKSDPDLLREDALKWAVHLLNDVFYYSIVRLLKQHPPDSVDEDGEPFWSGTRRIPKPLTYVDVENAHDLNQIQINTMAIDFVRAASRLRVEIYLTEEVEEFSLKTHFFSSFSEEEAKRAILKFSVDTKALLYEKKDLITSGSHLASSDSSIHDQILEMCYSVKNLTESYAPHLNIASFEKDDDTNYHVTFINAASNLRALCYSINTIGAMETRRIAGRIIPAMITTTGFVSALSCIELLKLVQGFKLERFRNSFINLALPFFAFTKPLPPEERIGVKGRSYTVWDNISFKESNKISKRGGTTLRQLIENVRKYIIEEYDETAYEITSISWGEYLLYANFLGDEALDVSIWHLLRDAIVGENDDIETQTRFGDEIDDVTVIEQKLEELDKKTFIDLSILVEDNESGEEAELPTVRLWKSNTKLDHD